MNGASIATGAGSNPAAGSILIGAASGSTAVSADPIIGADVGDFIILVVASRLRSDVIVNIAPVIGVILAVTILAVASAIAVAIIVASDIVGVGSGPVARETPIPALTTTIPAIAAKAPLFVTIL